MRRKITWIKTVGYGVVSYDDGLKAVHFKDHLFEEGELCRRISAHIDVLRQLFLIQGGLNG